MPRSVRHKKKSRERNALSPKTRKRIRTSLVALVIASLLGTGYWAYTEWRHYQRALRSRFPEFGIAMPAHHAIHGIDVSRYQRYISWPAVSSMKVFGIKLV